MKDMDVMLLSTTCIQSQLMKELLSESLDTPIQLVNQHTIINHKWNKPTLILIDLANLPTFNQPWEQYLRSFKDNKVSTVLLNTPNSISAQKLLLWPNVYGYFSHDEKHDTVIRGLTTVLKGEHWIPKPMLIEMLIYLQSVKPTTTTAIELTNREITVLHLLSNNKSNTEIANELFVSEHTIKSHLYKAFKKINVKNRIQAKRWARSHLPLYE
ncbi:LuxR C-terminal-related transcriptional regulator [Vibrio sp. CK2-1]|uniref:LuxR C-terminal-related transcriptional regulator n=1 Tax=Vibrio sp. CK2-1 TaxID=2912249 RepID=UPI001F027897|nr:LuxR C-terminal-related transcriptional regulator [Vibrio sp. CK2-1]